MWLRGRDNLIVLTTPKQIKTLFIFNIGFNNQIPEVYYISIIKNALNTTNQVIYANINMQLFTKDWKSNTPQVIIVKYFHCSIKLFYNLGINAKVFFNKAQTDESKSRLRLILIL